AGVLRGPSLGQRRLAIGVQLRDRAETVVRVAGRQQLLRVRLVEMQALGLPVRTARSADIGAFVPVEPEPAQIAEDARLGLARRALDVGVLDPEDEGAAVTPREEPVEQRRAGVADVQVPGGAGSETDSHGNMNATAWAAMASPRPTASTPSLVLPFTLTRET